MPFLAELLKDPKAQVTAAGALRNLAAQNVANQDWQHGPLPWGPGHRIAQFAKDLSTDGTKQVQICYMTLVKGSPEQSWIQRRKIVDEMLM